MSAANELEKVVRTAAEIMQETENDSQHKFLVEALVPCAVKMAISGKIKVGKTTFGLEIVRHVVRGVAWNGRVVQQAPVLYLTEQARASFKEELEAAGFGKDDVDLHVVHRPEVVHLGWPDIAAKAVALARDRGCKLVVIDTFNTWANVKDPFSPAAALEMNPLECLQNDGITVLFVFQSRKAECDIEDSIGGSYAFGGAVDLLLRMKKATGNQPNVRVVETMGRYPEVLSFTMRWVAERYEVVGDAHAVASAAVRQVLAALPELPSPGLTLEQIMEGSKASRGTVRRAIEQNATVVRSGAGTKTAPFIYNRSELGDSDQQPPETGLWPESNTKSVLEFDQNNSDANQLQTEPLEKCWPNAKSGWPG